MNKKGSIIWFLLAIIVFFGAISGFMYMWQDNNRLINEKQQSIDLFNRLKANHTNGNCGKINRQFIEEANMMGIKAIEHRLDGHIIAEVYYNWSWHVFDVDLGCYYESKGKILSVQELALEPLKLRSCNSTKIPYEELTKIYASTDDNVICTYLFGKCNVWKGVLG